MIELGIGIAIGLFILAMVINSLAKAHEQSQAAMNFHLKALAQDVHILALAANRLEAMTSKELQNRIDAQDAAERDRSRFERARLNQAIADGTARVFEG